MVEYVIAHCTVTPVRQEPSEGSEQLTQLLFGEVSEVLNRLPRWTKIRYTLDGQEGWVDFKMLTSAPISSQEVKGERLKIKGEGVISVPMAIATDMETGDELMLTLGTRLPNYAHGTFEVLGQQYLIDPTCVSTAQRSGNDCPIVAQRPLPLGRKERNGHGLLGLYASRVCDSRYQPSTQCPRTNDTRRTRSILSRSTTRRLGILRSRRPRPKSNEYLTRRLAAQSYGNHPLLWLRAY